MEEITRSFINSIFRAENKANNKMVNISEQGYNILNRKIINDNKYKINSYVDSA